jgi:hypothetical protein
VGDNTDSVHPEKRGAAVFGIVHRLLQVPKGGLENEGPEAALPAALQFVSQDPLHHFRSAFADLESHVADEAVTDDDVGLSLVELFAVQVADEVHRTPLQGGEGFTDHVGALRLFLADAEESHPGIGLAQDVAGIHLAHYGELDEVLRFAVQGRPRVQEGRHPVGSGELNRYGRPLDALEAPPAVLGVCHGGAGVAGGDKGPRFAAAHQVHRQADGRLLLLPHRLGGRFVHGDHLFGMLHRDRQVGGVVLVQLGADNLAVTDKYDGEAVLPGGLYRTLNHDEGSTVPPHGINGNCHRFLLLRKLFLWYLDDFPTFVVPAVKTDPVRRLGLLTLRAVREIGCRQPVMAAAFVPPRLRVLSLGMCHT